MKYKKGDVVICTQTRFLSGTTRQIFTKNKSYIISYDSYEHRFYLIDDEKDEHRVGETYLKDYFIKQSHLRKIKLNRVLK